MKKCTARQYSDQMNCHRCGLVWDMNDPDPPRCKTDEQLRREAGTEWISRIKQCLTPRD